MLNATVGSRTRGWLSLFVSDIAKARIVDIHLGSMPLILQWCHFLQQMLGTSLLEK